MVLLMHLARHRKILRRWLRWADVLVGMNLQYDILYLRHLPEFRGVLPGRHLVVDVSVLNYLSDETRPERSLKAVGPVLGTHRYDETIQTAGRFPDPHDEAFKRYNASDSHNSILACAELARRIERDFGPRTDKLSPSCMQFYSDTVWTVIRMAEAGICMDRWGLQDLEERLTLRCKRTHHTSSGRWGLPLEGPGSGKAKRLFLDLTVETLDSPPDRTSRKKRSVDYKRLLTESIETLNGATGSSKDPSGERTPGTSSLLVSSSSHPASRPVSGSVLNNPLLQFTPKQKLLSWTESNRNLLSSLLPNHHPLKKVFRLAKQHASAQKLLSSYVFPLLRHRRNNPLDQSSVIIPIGGQSCPSLNAPLMLSSSVGSPQKMESPPTNSSWTLRSSSTTPENSSSETRACPPRSPTTSSSRPSTSSSARRRTSEAKKAAYLRKKAGGPRKGIAYPTWYITPSFVKEGEGALGGTLQGRITCKKPSRQTFPPRIKRYLCSRRPNGVLVSFDLSQVELRVAAMLSGDDSLVEAFRLRTDLHSERAEQLFPGCSDLPDFRTFHRQVGKTVNFADLYLASPEKLQETILGMTGQTLPLPLCRSIVLSRSAHRPGLCAWHKHLFEQVEARGYLELPMTGQSRFFHLPEDRKEVVNFPIQTTAGNTLLYIQHALQRVLPTPNDRHPWVHMISQVYDSVEFDCDGSRVDDLKACFEAAVEYVQRIGYWARLETLHGRMIPLEYDMEITPS